MIFCEMFTPKTTRLERFSPVASKKVQSGKQNTKRKIVSSSKNDDNERQRINVTPDQLEFQIKKLRKVNSRSRNIFRKNSFRRKKSFKAESNNLPTITKIIHDSDSLKKLKLDEKIMIKEFAIKIFK